MPGEVLDVFDAMLALLRLHSAPPKGIISLSGNLDATRKTSLICPNLYVVTPLTYFLKATLQNSR